MSFMTRCAERMARGMNISGVTQTAQVLPQQQQPAPEAPPPSTESQSVSSDTVNLSAQVSTQVMDMAQQQFEQAANELVSQMAAATGVGANVDMSV